MASEAGGLSIKLFDRFEVKWNGSPISPQSWGRRKTQTLLKFLLLQRGRVVTTDQILDALYPSCDPQKAAGNLRTRISELRRVLEPTLKRGADSQYVLRLSPGNYRFSEIAPCQIDIELFEDHIKAAQQDMEQEHWSEALKHYQRALELYRGDLLAEDRYEEWTLVPRQHFRRLFLNALTDCAECHARLGQYANAIERLHHLIEQEPAYEGAYKQLMLYEYYKGDQQKALQAYDLCVAALREHLNQEPSPETRALRDRIQRGQERPAVPVRSPAPRGYG